MALPATRDDKPCAGPPVPQYDAGPPLLRRVGIAKNRNPTPTGWIFHDCDFGHDFSGWAK
jgi:hypothetical protein